MILHSLGKALHIAGRTNILIVTAIFLIASPSSVLAFRIYNKSDESIFIHVAMKGDSGTITTATIGADSDSTIRPDWPVCGWFKACSDQTFKVTFWRTKSDYDEYFWTNAAIGTAVNALASVSSGAELVATFYYASGAGQYVSQFFNKGLYGAANNLPYDGGWAVYWGKHYMTDVGSEPTTLSAPPRGYVLYVDDDGDQHEYLIDSSGSSDNPVSQLGLLSNAIYPLL